MPASNNASILLIRSTTMWAKGKKKDIIRNLKHEKITDHKSIIGYTMLTVTM